MKTLYDKLKPEYKQKLDEQSEKYPRLIENVILSLKDNYLWSHLTIGQAKDLIAHTDYTFGQMSSHDFAFGDRFFD